MNHLVERLYAASPVFVQNMAVTAYGCKLRSERYGAAGDEMLKELAVTSGFGKEQMYEYQERRFVNIAKHAVSTTEFYGNWSKENNINPDDIQSFDDLNLFPVVTKEEVRKNPEKFRSNLPLGGKNFCIYTSGTSGTPLKVYTDSVSRSRHYAFFSRLRADYGVRPIDKRVTLMGRVIIPAGRRKPPFWRYDLAQKNLLMSSYHLNESNLDLYYKKIRSFSPKEIFSYPSSLTELASHILKKEFSPIKVNMVMTTAEALRPFQKELIQAAFDGPIVNQYGCTEMSFFASSCEEVMLSHPEHGVLEVVDRSGEIRSNGNGSLVATGLINYSMPILRYLVGDEVTLGGRDEKGYQKIMSLSGRADDIVYASDDTPVGRLDPIFKGGSGIKEAQIEQRPDKSIILRLVPDHNYSDQKGVSLIKELRLRVGEGIKIDIELCESIARGKNGKFRPVISRLKGNFRYD